MSVVRIYAVGDVHGSRYLSIFLASLRSLVFRKPDICIFAGDMVDEGKVDDLETIIRVVKEKFPCIPIVSIFGNEEYHELEDRFIKQYPEIIWLNDTPTIIDVGGTKVGIVGTRGALERLTYWQRRHKPILERIYRERPKIVKKLLMEVRKHSDITILVSHYSPTFLTVRGEPEKVYPFMGSKEMERAIKEVKPDIVIHAHAHNARVTEALLEGIKIYNVSLPARRGVSLIEARPRKGLLDYVGVRA
jgi:Icc-related predicted phosphoesterase